MGNMTEKTKSKAAKSKVREMVPAASDTKENLNPAKQDPVENKEDLSPAKKLPDDNALVDLPEEMKVLPVNELKRLETLIEVEGRKSYSSYLSVGEALFEIDKSKLYKEQYGTFVNYCNIRWGYSRTYSFDLVGAYKVYKNLTAIANISKIERIFTNESQLRPLRKLKSDEDRLLVLDKLDEKVKDKPITASIVKEQINCFDPKTKKFADKPIQKRSTYTSSTDKKSLKKTDIEATESGFSFTKLDDEKVKKFQARISEVLAEGGSIEIICKPKKAKKIAKKKETAKKKSSK
jgi:hypothetical protein